MRFHLPRLLLLCALFVPVVGQADHDVHQTRLLLISEEEELRISRQAWTNTLNDPNVTLSINPAETDPVLRVAERIIAAAKRSDYAKRAQSLEWEIVTIKDDDTQNAWALDGGKIAIHTGMFPMLFTESGLAAVIGHEVGHALMRHGTERASQHRTANVGLNLAGLFLGLDPVTGQLANLAITGGVLLPFSRSHESEADHLGLLLAAEAGYDPEAAVFVWERMAESSDGAPPEFLSTHPAHDTRIANLTRWMPEAVEMYERSRKAPDALLPDITTP